MQCSPQISVVMSVYNAGNYLQEAIDSILNQTYTDFEFLIVNDGSTDNSLVIINSYSDPRIKLINNEGNKGLIYSLNKAFSQASGKYIARMDADDISLPERLQLQYQYMEANPQIGVCGSHTLHFSTSGSYVSKSFLTHEEISGWMLFNASVVHPTLMLRVSCLRQLDHYFDPSFAHAEDYELWSRLIFKCRFGSVDAVLLKYRVHEGQVTQKYRKEQVSNANRVRIALLERAGFQYTKEDLEAHCLIGSSGFIEEKKQLFAIENWLQNMHEQNAKLRFVDQQVMDKILGKQWYDSCGITSLGLKAVRIYLNSPLGKLPNGKLAKLIAKAIVRKFRKGK